MAGGSRWTARLGVVLPAFAVLGAVAALAQGAGAPHLASLPRTAEEAARVAAVTAPPAETPEAEARLMGGYAGSVALSGGGSAIAITSPKGGRLQRFDASTATFLDAFARPEVCGVAPLAKGLVVSDGLGGLVALEPGGPRPLGRFDMAWDNHLVAL